MVANAAHAALCIAAACGLFVEFRRAVTLRSGLAMVYATAAIICVAGAGAFVYEMIKEIT